MAQAAKQPIARYNGTTGKLVPVLLLGLLLSGCDAPEHSSAADISAPDDSEIVAEVGDGVIRATDLDAQIQAMASRGDKPAREAALEERIDLHLLARRAEREDMHQQPETAAEIRRQRDMLLANQLLRARIDQLDIGEQALREAYDEYVAAAEKRREYKVRHILVDSRERAQTLVEQIENGADFSALAREHSTGPSAERGGDLSWLRAGDVVAPFAEAMTDLAREEYTDEPVETRFGWHIILVDDIRENEAKAFDEVRDRLRDQLVDEHIRDFLRGLRAEADIEIK